MTSHDMVQKPTSGMAFGNPVRAIETFHVMGDRAMGNAPLAIAALETVDMLARSIPQQ